MTTLHPTAALGAPASAGAFLLEEDTALYPVGRRLATASLETRQFDFLDEAPASADRVGGAAAAAREAERHALENERLRSQLLFYATAPLGRAAAKARGGARSKSAHSLTMPLPPV